MTALYLASRCCQQCITTRCRLVSGHRAAEIVGDCKRQHIHFFCHHGDGRTLHCRGVHNRFGSAAHDFAVHHGIPVVELVPETLDDE